MINSRDAYRKSIINSKAKSYISVLEKHVIGTDHPSSKLNDRIVRYIRESEKSSYKLAKELGVDPSTIRDVKNNKTWRHII